MKDWNNLYKLYSEKNEIASMLLTSWKLNKSLDSAANDITDVI